MASQREIIRGAIVTALQASDSLAGQRVFPARVLPIQSLEELPCLLVYTTEEKSESTGDRLFLRRTCTLSIEGAVIGAEEEIDSLIDQMADQVEQCVNGDARLSGLLHDDLVLKSTVSEVAKDGHQVFGGFRMDYDAVYMTRRVADEYPETTAPTKLWTVPSATPEEYDDILGITPKPMPQSDTACGPNGCNLPAWQGEVDP